VTQVPGCKWIAYPVMAEKRATELDVGMPVRSSDLSPRKTLFVVWQADSERSDGRP